MTDSNAFWVQPDCWSWRVVELDRVTSMAMLSITTMSSMRCARSQWRSSTLFIGINSSPDALLPAPLKLFWLGLAKNTLVEPWFVRWPSPTIRLARPNLPEQSSAILRRAGCQTSDGYANASDQRLPTFLMSPSTLRHSPPMTSWLVPPADAPDPGLTEVTVGAPT